MGTPPSGYAVGHDGSLYRNGERVGEVMSVTFDRDARAFWGAYRSWRGSPLDTGSRGWPARPGIPDRDAITEALQDARSIVRTLEEALRLGATEAVGE